MFKDLFTRKTSILSAGLLSGGADRHSHILPGVDDGVKTMEESLEILSFLEDAGLKSLWLTPHTAEDMPNTTEALQLRFSGLKAAYQGKIELNLASEYMLDTLYERHLEERDLLTMEEDTVLVETSTWNPPYNMEAILHSTMSAGYRPLLAHPERYRFTRNFDILIACVDSRKSRKEIFQTLPKKNGPYVLDGGVLATCGQVIIGNGSKELPYPYVELPTLIDTKVKEQNLPSCSLAESLSVQELFVNQWLATAELELCWRLFRKGGLDYRGFYINLDTGRMNPVPID